jgi:hypothetical protein
MYIKLYFPLSLFKILHFLQNVLYNSVYFLLNLKKNYYIFFKQFCNFSINYINLFKCYNKSIVNSINFNYLSYIARINFIKNKDLKIYNFNIFNTNENIMINIKDWRKKQIVLSKNPNQINVDFITLDIFPSKLVYNSEDKELSEIDKSIHSGILKYQKQYSLKNKKEPYIDGNIVEEEKDGI